MKDSLKTTIVMGTERCTGGMEPFTKETGLMALNPTKYSS